MPPIKRVKGRRRGALPAPLNNISNVIAASKGQHRGSLIVQKAEISTIPVVNPTTSQATPCQIEETRRYKLSPKGVEFPFSLFKNFMGQPIAHPRKIVTEFHDTPGLKALVHFSDSTLDDATANLTPRASSSYTPPAEDPDVHESVSTVTSEKLAVQHYRIISMDPSDLEKSEDPALLALAHFLWEDNPEVSVSIKRATHRLSWSNYMVAKRLLWEMDLPENPTIKVMAQSTFGSLIGATPLIMNHFADPLIASHLPATLTPYSSHVLPGLSGLYSLYVVATTPSTKPLLRARHMASLAFIGVYYGSQAVLSYWNTRT